VHQRDAILSAVLVADAVIVLEGENRTLVAEEAATNEMRATLKAVRRRVGGLP
jgi:hypothetical protein